LFFFLFLRKRKILCGRKGTSVDEGKTKEKNRKIRSMERNAPFLEMPLSCSRKEGWEEHPVWEEGAVMPWKGLKEIRSLLKVVKASMGLKMFMEWKTF
jgi:hypothetical protein